MRRYDHLTQRRPTPRHCVLAFRMPSVGKRFSFATLRRRFTSHDESSGIGNPDLDRVRKSGTSVSLAGKRSESLPPEMPLPSIPYQNVRTLSEPAASPESALFSADATVVESPDALEENSDKLAQHQRSLSMPIPHPLPLDKPVPPLPPPSPVTYTVASPESFASSQAPPSSFMMPSSPPFSPPMTPPPDFSPVMNLHAIGVLAQVDAGPKTTKAEKLLNKIGM